MTVFHDFMGPIYPVLNVIFDLSDSSAETFPKIVVEYSISNADGSGIPHEIETGARGIVYAGFPTGAPAEPNGGGQAEQLRLAAEVVPVVMSHRGADGWPYRRRTILEGGSFIWGDTLSPQKAAILLSLSLTKTSDPKEIQEIFLEY